MAIVEFSAIQPLVYVVLGIDEHEHDQVIAVCQTYEDAKQYCIQMQVETQFYDLWIEKHPLV